MLQQVRWARTALLVIALVVMAGSLLHLALSNQVQPKLGPLRIVEIGVLLLLNATAVLALTAATRAGYFRHRSQAGDAGPYADRARG